MKIVAADEFKLQRDVDYGTPEQNASVKEIVAAVKAQGDEALLRYSKQFDGVELEVSQLRVTEQELKAAYAKVEPAFVQAIASAANNIRAFHLRQKRESWMDVQQDGTIF